MARFTAVISSTIQPVRKARVFLRCISSTAWSRGIPVIIWAAAPPAVCWWTAG